MQAIVLAGGRGDRMWPLSESFPKAMTMLNGKPVLRHHVEWLQAQGVIDVVIACGYKSKNILRYLQSNPIPGINVIFSIESNQLGRGGASKKAREYLPYPKDPCIISQGDTVSDMPLGQAYLEHLRVSAKGVLLTLLLVPYRSRHAVVEVGGDGLITRFQEKPRLPYWAHAGTYVASPGFFNLLPDKGDENETVDQLVAVGAVRGFHSHCYWLSVDTPKDIATAERDLALVSLPHEPVF